MNKVEEHYKLDVTTTLIEQDYIAEAVEEHYKLDVTTTRSVFFTFCE
jgi:hypothetical protein